MATGYNAHSDILTRTVDGRDLNDLWSTYQQVLAEWNRGRDGLVSFLTYSVTNPVEDVPIVGQDANFEKASEYGEPVGFRPGPQVMHMGFDFDWYDLAARFTWQFIADAPADQLDSIQNAALEADSRLVTTEVLRTLFSNSNRNVSINKNPYQVYTFYNADGTVPPKYKTNTFDGTHSHFFTTGSAEVLPGDVENHIDALDEHGYSVQNGYSQVLMVNRAQMQLIRTWKANQDYSSTDSGGATVTSTATYDFIPSNAGAQAMILPNDTNVVGQNPPNQLRGMTVMGSYGPLLIVQEDYIPAGYFVSFATGGQENLRNPIGIREHANTALRGMRLVKGRTPDYPLIDSFYVRGFGTGVRHRGAAAITQVTTGASYTPPSTFTV